MGIIEKIQNKPESVKIKIMWGVSIVVVILLIFIWALSYNYRKNIPTDKTNNDNIFFIFFNVND